MPDQRELPDSLLQSPSFQIERVRRHTKDEVERALAAASTTMREFWALTCVADAPASQKELAGLLGVDASDMVRLIDSLESKSWVSRDRDPGDRRRQIVTATKKGRRKLSDLAVTVAEAEQRALDASTNKQLKHLRKLSQALLSEDAE
ncbi:MarR family winged helix-turn-helix transcriptional regulator [Corynebacterium aquatimens]|uniref:DNA-binding MarR family transcriptional regulator n=1 Tax=Corynebacterium aquatimens TaxID=1190508 RepID=A0A931E4L1_9CORY|nr:MarR family transcriptional regulator [Corynebacterium aquatimens]MBG6122358.1 DNA-binding MarR family transcriptional regulator [Corynebacterium aquatimens]